MGKYQRIKTAAAEFVPATRAEADEAIRIIGEQQRKRADLETAMNNRLAEVKADFEQRAHPLAESIRALSQGVQTWAEANRAELTKSGRKTVRLGNGEIRWRARPPSVTVRAAQKAIAALKLANLTRFIRNKEEVNKEAILAEPEAVTGIKGLTIGSGEDFVIVPFATELEEVA